MKPFLVILGLLSATLILGQLVLGLLILQNSTVRLIKIHQHSGYTAVAVSLAYIVLSLSHLLARPKV